MTQNDGGAAFPVRERKASKRDTSNGGEVVTVHYPPQSGMSLRDYFAAAALQGIIAATDRQDANENKKHSDLKTAKIIAGWAYLTADAMLTARERKE